MADVETVARGTLSKSRRSRKEWLGSEVEHLRSLRLDEHRKVAEIAAALEREPKDVVNKLHRLGIVIQPHRKLKHGVPVNAAE
jgi:hypothetical protein